MWKRVAVVIVLGLVAAELARLEFRVAALKWRVSDEADRIEGALGAAAMATEAALESHAARKRERAESRRASMVDLFLFDRSTGAEITSATVMASVWKDEHAFGYVVPVKAKGWALWSFDRKGCDTWRVTVDAGPTYPTLVLERGCFRLTDDGSYFAAYGLAEQKR